MWLTMTQTNKHACSAFVVILICEDKHASVINI